MKSSNITAAEQCEAVCSKEQASRGFRAGSRCAAVAGHSSYRNIVGHLFEPSMDPNAPEVLEVEHSCLAISVPFGAKPAPTVTPEAVERVREYMEMCRRSDETRHVPNPGEPSGADLARAKAVIAAFLDVDWQAS